MAPNATALKRKPTSATPRDAVEMAAKSHKRRASFAASSSLSLQPNSKLLNLPHELQHQILDYVFDDAQLSYTRSRSKGWKVDLRANHQILLSSKLCYYRWLSLYYSNLQLDITRHGSSLLKVLKSLPRTLRRNMQHLRLDQDHQLPRTISYFNKFSSLRVLECSLHPIDLGDRSLDTNDKEALWQRIKERSHWNQWSFLIEDLLNCKRKFRYLISFDATWPVDGVPGAYDFMPCTYEVGSGTFSTSPERKYRSTLVHVHGMPRYETPPIAAVAL